MAQKNTLRKTAKKATPKKSKKKPLSPTSKKSAKTGVKGKASGLSQKKKSTMAKKSTSTNVGSKKSNVKKAKAAQSQKSRVKSSEKKKRLSPSPLKKPRTTSGRAGAPKLSARPSSPELTATERYNIGGLFACAVERTSDPDFSRLRSVLRELELTPLEKDNLIRLSEGVTIPKLFADGMASDKAGWIVERLVKFAMVQGAYERTWQSDIRQVAGWLGMLGSEVEALEQRVGAK